jgi:hypothetical protein
LAMTFVPRMSRTRSREVPPFHCMIEIKLELKRTSLLTRGRAHGTTHSMGSDIGLEWSTVIS